MRMLYYGALEAVCRKYTNRRCIGLDGSNRLGMAADARGDAGRSVRLAREAIILPIQGELYADNTEP